MNFKNFGDNFGVRRNSVNVFKYINEAFYRLLIIRR